MGEVYRARDTRLAREVAIKVLPAARGAEAAALARFEREAQAVAALSHPNILAIHDYGRHEDVVYTVSELLEGETLAHRLAAGPIPVRKAIEYAAQIARGLAAAHRRGVVHRDLKPDNVFLTQDGQVKILDFGLAKMLEAGPGASDATLTRIGTHTDPGTVLGTVGYMAPEQARGREADHRSDIFSLGAILYEMLSGRRAFVRQSPADTLAAILNEDPPEIKDAERDIPPGVELLVRHCLEKNPDERFHSAHDLAFGLELMSGSSISIAPAQLSAPVRRRGRGLVPAAVGLAVLGAATAAAFWLGRGAEAEPVPEFQRLTFRRGSIRSARATTDGQTIVYGAAWEGEPIRVFVTRPGSPESQQLELPDADVLAVSSRGELAISIGRRFLSPHQNTGTLARVALTGGTPRLVLEHVQEADWSPDGEELAAVREDDGLNRLEYPIGNEIFSTRGWISSPRVSPDGRRVAFLEHEARWDDGGWVAVVDREGQHQRLSEYVSSSEGLAWSPAGDEIWFTASPSTIARGLHAVTLGGKTRVLHQQAGNLTLFDRLADGRLLLGSTNQRREIRFGAAGRAERDLSWLDWSLSTFLSRDGTTLLINEQGDGGAEGYSIYLRHTDGSPPVNIGQGVPIGVSPDGRWVLAGVQDETGGRLFLYPTGPGTPRELVSFSRSIWGSWFPDGQRVVYHSIDDEPSRLFVLDLARGEPRQLPAEGFILESFSDAVAPSGEEFIARKVGGAPHILSATGENARPVPGLEAGDTAIRWSDDGRWIYFYRQGMPATYGRVEVATGKREPLGELAPPDRAGAVGTWPVLVSGDGASYAYSYPRFLTDLFLVEGIR